MAKFLYQIKSPAGQLQNGQMDAIDETEVRIRLRSQNLSVVKVAVAPGSRIAGGKTQVGGGLFQSKVNSKDLQIFTRQFSTLINAGIPVVDSLKLLGDGKRHPMLKEAANSVKNYIEGGKRLGDAMQNFPLVFDKFYVNMVRAGEEAGILDGILLRLSIYLEKSEKIKKQVVGAMVYPAIIIFVASVVVAGILIFIIPKFQDLYSSSGRELPMLTQMVVTMSSTLIHKWYLVLGVLIGVPYGIFAWYQTPEGKDIVDAFLIRAPMFGELIQKSALAKMTRTLSTLLSSGVGVIEALDIAAKTSGNGVMEKALIRCKESVTAGRPLAAPLTKEPMIPDMVAQMIAIGEQSGTLDVMLGKIADFYEDDVETAVKALTSMIEPLLMMFLGGIIAFLVTAMYLPIFDIAATAGH